MPNGKRMGVLAAAGVLGLGAAAAATAERPGQIIPYEDRAAVALGAAVYEAHCAACHGANLEGQVPEWRVPGPDGLLPAPPHDETGHTWHHPDALLLRITALGTAAVVGGGYRSGMPGFDGVLAPEEIVAALAFIKSTWPGRVIEIHNRINADFAAANGG